MKQYIPVVLTLAMMLGTKSASAQKPNLYWIEQMPVEDRKKSKGVMFRITSGKQGSVVQFKMKKGAIVPLHKNAEEQCIFIVKGSVQATVGDSVLVLKACEAMLIAANVIHGFKSLEHGTNGYYIPSPKKKIE